MMAKQTLFENLYSITIWKEERDQIRNVDLELSQIIDQINPTDDLKLIKLNYPFGTKIIAKNTLFLPCYPNTQVSLVNDSRVPAELKSLLDYNTIPLMLSLNKANELFLKTKQCSIPIDLLMPGHLLGLVPTLSYLNDLPTTYPWCINSGARTIFLLAKITDTNAHKKLVHQFNTDQQPPESLWDHCKVFAEIANYNKNQIHWQSENIVFTKPWLENVKKDPAWKSFKDYLYRKSWDYSSAFRQHTMLDMVWTLLHTNPAGQQLKHRSYLLNTVKHILAISLNVAPAFVAADTAQLVAPTAIIEEAYTDVYGLKDYLPIIMHPNPLTSQQLNSNPRYYSLALPTLMECCPNSKTSPNIIHELREVKYLLEKLHKTMDLHPQYGLKKLQNLKYEYFHMNADTTEGIQLAEKIPNKDSSVLKTHKQYEDKTFPAYGRFMRGCIRITEKNDELSL